MTVRRLLWLLTLVASLVTPALAQELRQVPPSPASVADPYAVSGQAFVEDVDVAGVCDCQVIALRDTAPVKSGAGAPRYSVYSGWTEGFTRVPTSPDLLIVDTPSGTGWLVHATPLQQVLWLPANLLSEWIEIVHLRPGVRWVAADLDNDSRDDLVGYAPGEVIRYFRRGK